MVFCKEELSIIYNKLTGNKSDNISLNLYNELLSQYSDIVKKK